MSDKTQSMLNFLEKNMFNLLIHWIDIKSIFTYFKEHNFADFNQTLVCKSLENFIE